MLVSFCVDIIGAFHDGVLCYTEVNLTLLRSALHSEHLEFLYSVTIWKMHSAHISL